MILHVWKYSRDVSPPRFVRDRVIDNASSVLWVERYQESGEFEIIMKATPELLRYFTENELIITRTNTDRIMIPERTVLNASTDSGDVLTISGGSGESIPNRRIIMQDITMNGFKNGAHMLYYLMQENISSYWYYHTDAKHPESGKFRYMPFFAVGNVTELPDKEEIKTQPWGQNLGTFTATICSACEIGFRVRFEPSSGMMYYEFYRGEDKSKEVIFAKDFKNLGDTEYSFDKRTYFNRVTISGEGVGKDRARQTQTLHNSERAAGFTLREKYMDAPHISSNTVDENGEPITEVLYNVLLAKIAIAELNASKEEIKFDGTILPNGQFQYRQDYCLGDKVTVRNDYGINGTATVTEVTEYEGKDGIRVVPKFSQWEV